MIKSLTVENFQQHKHAHVDFCAGVNVFAGTSDIGKSALIRALLWVITNRPQGLDFRNWDCKKNDPVIVTIETDKDTVVRQRSEIENAYYLNGTKYVAMKSGVPEEIEQALGMPTVNIQTQYMPHYLLSASSGEVSRVLNEACDLTIIDHTIKSINTITARAIADNKAATAEIEELEQQLDELEWVADAEARLESITAEFERIQEKQASFDKLEQLVVYVKDVTSQVEFFAQKQGVWESFPSIVTAVHQVTELSSTVKGISVILNELDNIAIEQAKIQFIPDKQLQTADKFCAALAGDEKQYNDLLKLVVLLREVDAQIEQATTAQHDTQAKLFEVWQETDTCPLCGAEMEHDQC